MKSTPFSSIHSCEMSLVTPRCKSSNRHSSRPACRHLAFPYRLGKTYDKNILSRQCKPRASITAVFAARPCLFPRRSAGTTPMRSRRRRKTETSAKMRSTTPSCCHGYQTCVRNDQKNVAPRSVEDICKSWQRHQKPAAPRQDIKLECFTSVCLTYVLLQTDSDRC